MTDRHTLASIVIVTRNRKMEVLRALESCFAQAYSPVEVLVFDDASDDGTAEEVKFRFPTVCYERSESQVGYITLRNQGFLKARGEFLFSIDDDAFFTDPQTIERTIALFQHQARVAAIALPYSEPRGVNHGKMREIKEDRRLRSYVGCAHALRRRVILELGGYREFFVHQGEERDLCIRLMQSGYEIIYGDTPPLMHLYSPKREVERVSYYSVRNTLLFDMLNVPHPYFFPRLMLDVAQLMLRQVSITTLPRRVYSLCSGLLACMQYADQRRPVERSTYRLYRSFPRHGPT